MSSGRMATAFHLPGETRANGKGPSSLEEKNLGTESAAAERFEESTGHKYATQHLDVETTRFLEERYGVKGFSVCGKVFPIHVLWQAEKPVEPDSVLAENHAFQHPTKQVVGLEREFVERIYSQGEIRGEKVYFSMRNIELRPPEPPVIHGDLVLYFDNVLTQMALRWELCKAVAKNVPLTSLRALRRRSEIERGVNVLNDGCTCYAAMSINTIDVLPYKDGEFFCTVAQRSRL